MNKLLNFFLWRLPLALCLFAILIVLVVLLTNYGSPTWVFVIVGASMGLLLIILDMWLQKFIHNVNYMHKMWQVGRHIDKNLAKNKKIRWFHE